MHHTRGRRPVDNAETLRMAAEAGDLGAVRAELLDGRVDIDAGGRHGVTALHRACERGREEVVRALLQGGADCSRTTARGGQTALHLAAAKGNARVVQMLVDSGANIRQTDARGWDATAFASSRNQTDVVLLLARAAGDVDRECGGITAASLLDGWHGNRAAAERARAATHNSQRVVETLWRWHEQADADRSALHAAALSAAGTPVRSRSAEGEPGDGASPVPLPGSPRDAALADAEEQQRQQEAARVSDLLMRSRTQLNFTAAETSVLPAEPTLGGASTDDSVSSPSAAADQLQLSPPAEAPAESASTVRDLAYGEQQDQRRARIARMREDLQQSLDL